MNMLGRVAYVNGRRVFSDNTHARPVWLQVRWYLDERLISPDTVRGMIVSEDGEHLTVRGRLETAGEKPPPPSATRARAPPLTGTGQNLI